jgi:hypothetical protein
MVWTTQKDDVSPTNLLMNGGLDVQTRIQEANVGI